MRSDGLAADVVIVGGGFSGTMLAAELARRGVSAVLIEGSGRAGRGTAFSTSEEAHLLNVPAGRMGAWADKPEDFAHAIAEEGFNADDFVPRRRYGEYLRKILDTVEASGKATVVREKAVAARREGERWTVEISDGSRIEGKALALAQGNQAPQTPGVARSIDEKFFLNDPWSEGGRAAIKRVSGSGGDILLVGTGLTMVDVVLSLDEARHQGRIVALSRRGQAPRAHAAFDPVPVELGNVPQGAVLALWRWLRRRGAEIGWRAAIDSLRPHSHSLWQALDEREKRRFLRHARPWWDVHRHRIAPEVAGRIRRLVELGRLEIVAGRLTDMWAEDGWLSARIEKRGGTAPNPSSGPEGGQRFALAVNCTGPLGSISDSQDGVLRSLFEAGLARADRLGIGLEVDANSRVTGAPNAWALGPLTKGPYWEITAVPDIRGQVADVAKDISMELNP